jgi:hypothetical protein
VRRSAIRFNPQKARLPGQLLSSALSRARGPLRRGVKIARPYTDMWQSTHPPVRFGFINIPKRFENGDRVGAKMEHVSSNAFNILFILSFFSAFAAFVVQFG